MRGDARDRAARSEPDRGSGIAVRGSGPARPIRRPAPRLDGAVVANAAVAFLFGVTGPIAILVSVAAEAGLSDARIGSWIFAGYVIGGAMSIGFSIRYRQPLLFHFSIPGTVLAGPALQRLSFDEVVGAYLVTALVVAVIGASGAARRFMSLIPGPIVLGMVAGVFLPFGLAVLTAFGQTPWIAFAATAAYVALAADGRVSRAVPPVFGALVVGSIVVAVSPGFELARGLTAALADPVFERPAFSPRAIAELVVPLAVTVVAVNNAQGFVIVREAGHRPPVDAATAACGLGSMAFAVMGSVPACLPGVMMAIVASGRNARAHYLATAAIGALFVLFGIFAPVTVALALSLPMSFVAALGGLALISVLRSTFAGAFGGSFSLGALVAFMVTVSGTTLLGIGSGFWGLVFGVAVSAALERDDFRERVAAARPGAA